MRIKVNGVQIVNLKYVDDTIVSANDAEELQEVCNSRVSLRIEY